MPRGYPAGYHLPHESVVGYVKNFSDPLGILIRAIRKFREEEYVNTETYEDDECGQEVEGQTGGMGDAIWTRVK